MRLLIDDIDPSTQQLGIGEIWPQTVSGFRVLVDLVTCVGED